MEAAMRKITSLAVFFVIVVLMACGSTKVYTAEKTMTYHGSLYTLTGVSKISSRVDAETPDGETLDLRGVNKAQFKALKEKHGALRVTAVLVVGEEEIVVQTATVEKFSQLEKMTRNLDSKMEKIGKFMKDGKKTQLNLK
jgi:hypothetical protein